jgi:hypothetical protein
MADPTAHYVALGDSISIDDYSGGPGCGGASLLVANRDDDFPEWRGRDLLTADRDTTFSLLAADGATTRTLLDARLPRLATLRVRAPRHRDHREERPAGGLRGHSRR